MKAIVHLPSNVKTKEEFNRRTTAIYSEAVIKFIINLECSPEQKLQLLDSIKNSK